jgi:hypothetical protein
MPADDEPGRALPRHVILPGDPPALRRWLAAKAAERGEELPDDCPTEEAR